MNTMKILILFLTLCVSLQTFADKPKWLTAPQESCKSSELCAIGMGASRNFAEADGRAAIAKIFMSKVHSSFSQEVSAFGGTITNEIKEKVEQRTDAILEGVEIRSFYEDDTDIYALAVLNKRKAATSFKAEIEKIDEKLKVYSTENSSRAAREMRRLSIERTGLDKRYEFLTGFSIPAPISFKQIFAARKKFVSKYVIHVYIDEKEPKVFTPKVMEFLTQEGFKVTTGNIRSKQATHMLTGEITVEKMYMKVEGFSKYKFTANLTSANLKGVESGKASFFVVSTGRNLQQAYDKAVVQLIDKLKENMQKLQFEN